MERERHCTNEGFEGALLALGRAARRVPASGWPGDLERLDDPGLYSWWVDDSGAEDLSRGLGQRLDPGRIYAGQTGATKWPSGKVGAMTLRDRLANNHLSGSIYGSTFRRTLAACLFELLALELVDPGKLAPPSERQLGGWMREHLGVAIHPFPNRDALGDLEDRVLAILDPPLNLEGMPAAPIRKRLSELRGRLMSPATVAQPAANKPPRHKPVAGPATHPVPPGGRVTLHEELADILRQAARPMTTTELAEAVNERRRYVKRDGSAVTPFEIHGRTRNYPRLFERAGSTVRLRPP